MGTTRSNAVIMPNSEQGEHPSRESAMNGQMRPDNALPIFHGTTKYKHITYAACEPMTDKILPGHWLKRSKKSCAARSKACMV